MESIIYIILGAITFGLPILMLFAMCSEFPTYHKMSRDDEIEWLISQGCTQEEAEEIADL